MQVQADHELVDPFGEGVKSDYFFVLMLSPVRPPTQVVCPAACISSVRNVVDRSPLPLALENDHALKEETSQRKTCSPEV